ncbi:alpha/beta fold hydrolase [Leptospira wolbachii]|nr:alpha/beta fold hydrolase [Leptospira wolbachii]
MRKIILNSISIFTLIWILNCSEERLTQNPRIGPSQECIVLVHGYLRSSNHLRHLRDFLIQKGFYVVSIDYPSTTLSIQEIADSYLSSQISDHCQDKKIHFVTHSLGGVIVRYYLKTNQIKNLGRVIMLAPPNQGSEIADLLSQFKFLNSFFGPILAQIKTDPSSFVHSLGLPNFEFAIITGDFTLDPISSFIIPGIDDGRVSVSNTILENRKDFLIVERSHNYIMDAPEVQDAILTYIQIGRFR